MTLWSVSAVESAAKGLIDSWRKTYNGPINKLQEADRDKFYNIWRQARTPQQVTLIMPTQITSADKAAVTRAGERVLEDVPRHRKHIYTDSSGSYPARLTGWEVDVVGAELKSRTLHGWYRNPTGGRAALAVPYEQSRKSRTLYPDFIFIHDVDGVLAIDIVDPHRPSESDTGPKWVGLAHYAQQHGAHIRRVLAVIKDDNGTLVSLDLKNPDVKKQLESASNETDIRAVFESLGGSY